MTDVLASMPDNWKHPIILNSSEGRDDFGDPIEGVEVQIDGCLLAVSETSDLDNLNSNPTLRGKVFVPKGYEISSTSQIKTLYPAPVVGTWAVDGQPIHWPFGTEVRVEWETSNV